MKQLDLEEEANKLENVEIDGIDFTDYPDFTDAFISYAERNGKPLTEKELDAIDDDTVYHYVIQSII